MKNSYILLRFRPEHFHRLVVHATTHLSIDDERHHHAYTAHDDRHQSHARRFAVVEIFHPFVHEQCRREVGQHAARHDIKQIRPELGSENIPETRAHYPADGHAPPTQAQGVEQHGEHTGERYQYAEHRQSTQKIGVIRFLFVISRRTNIEIIDRFFAPGEVSEIWLTFSDPQMKKATKRLTSTFFMERYRRFLKDGGTIHVKTDSNFMFTYTKYMVEKNGLPVEFITDDLYHSGWVDDILGIRTYYEQQWLDRGLTIKYIKFLLPQCGELQEPDVEIELDEYRSYNRSKRSGLQTSK